MIKLGFIGPNRKILKFVVEGKKIIYFDEIWKNGVQIMPLDTNLTNKLIKSGKPNLKVMAALIFDANRGDNLNEYESCETEEELAEFIRKDCKTKGLLEIK